MAAQSMDIGTKGAPRQRMVRRILQEEAYRRITAGDVAETLSEFAAELSAWFRDAYPGTRALQEASIEEAIRDTWDRRHRMIGTEL
jgi:hypothetical protein